MAYILTSGPVLCCVFHIERIGCQPERTTLHGGSRSSSAEQGKEREQKEQIATEGISGDASTCMPRWYAVQQPDFYG